MAADPDPDTAAETRRSDGLLAEFGEGCVEESGDLAGHMSTVEAARTSTCSGPCSGTRS